MRWLIVASLTLVACRHHTTATLAVVGDSTKLRRGDALPATSAIFDGHTVRLRGARGEILGVQVLTHTSARASLTVDGARVDAFAVHYLEVREPSTALYGGSRGAGAWPDPLEPVRAPVAGDALFDVAIPAAAAPGLHRGRLEVGGRVLLVELTVERLTIDVAAAPLVWIWYQPAEIARALGLPDDDATLLPVEAKYHALVRAHGAYLASDLPPARFEARLAYLAGTRYWPVHLDEQRLRADADAWERRFASLPQVPFAQLVDEPRDPAARAEARREGEAIGPHAKLLRTVTAPPSPDFGDAVDVFIGPASRPPHRWTYNGAPPSAGSLVIDTEGTALRSWGWIAARYGVELWYAWEGTYYADRYNGGGATDPMTQPLTFDQRRKGVHDPDWGNGDGVLVYPGKSGPWPSLRLEALRRGLQDRALLAALAACGAADVAAAETRALVPVALDEGRGAAAWPAAEAPWEAARNRLYDAWRARCAKGAP
jgi:hypothetical protein